MGVTWIEPTELTVTNAASYEDEDLSALVPAGTTGILLHVINTNASTRKYACRKNGSTDARPGTLVGSGHQWAACGLDANRVCELYKEVVADITFYLVGYFDDCAVFNTNAPDVSLGSANTWTDIDLSVNDGAIGAIVEIYNAGAVARYGLQCNGSTDARFQYLYGHAYAFIGVDEGELLEGYITTTDVDFFITGYIKADCTFNVNATDLSLTTTAEWTDLPSALPEKATGGFIEVYATAADTGTGFRKNGSSEDIYRNAYRHCWGTIECDINRLIEGRIAATTTDFFLTGYATAKQKLIAVGGAAISLAGTLTKRTSKAMSGATTVTGALIKQAAKSVGGGALNPSSVLDAIKQASEKLVDVGGAILSPVGDLARAATFKIAAGAATVNTSGILTRAITKYFGGAVNPAGTLSKQIDIGVGDAAITPAGDTAEKFISMVDTGQGAITPVGAFAKAITYARAFGAGALSPVGTLTKRISKYFAGSVAPAGSIGRHTGKAVGQGAITPVGLLSRGMAYLRDFGQGILTPTGSFSGTKKQLGFAGRINRALYAIKDAFNR